MLVLSDPVAVIRVSSVLKCTFVEWANCLQGVTWCLQLLVLSTLPPPDHNATLEHASLNPCMGIITRDEMCHLQQLLPWNQITLASLAFRGGRYDIINIQHHLNEEQTRSVSSKPSLFQTNYWLYKITFAATSDFMCDNIVWFIYSPSSI